MTNMEQQPPDSGHLAVAEQLGAQAWMPAPESNPVSGGYQPEDQITMTERDAALYNQALANDGAWTPDLQTPAPTAVEWVPPGQKSLAERRAEAERREEEAAYLGYKAVQAAQTEFDGARAQMFRASGGKMPTTEQVKSRLASRRAQAETH